MSLWSDYVRECGILQIVEEPWGFITFHVEQDCLWINDVFVEQTSRKSGRARALLDAAIDYGQLHGCTHVKTSVFAKSRVAGISLAAGLAAGFQLHGAQLNSIILAKPIEGAVK